MEFLAWDLEVLLINSSKLQKNTLPQWGSLSSQQMVEHLTDSIRMSIGELVFPIEVTEELTQKYQIFLDNDKEMAQNTKVSFVLDNPIIRNKTLALALDEFAMAFIHFTEYYQQNPNTEHVHPYFGFMGLEKWQKLHRKHFHHHFKQFAILSI